MLDFLETDTTIIYNTLFSALENELGEPLYPGDERTMFAKAIIGAIASVQSRCNDACKQSLLRFARGEQLDKMGERVICDRILESPAKTTLEYYFDNGHYSATDVAVDSGTVILTEVATVPAYKTVTVTADGEPVAHDAVSSEGYDSENGTLTITGVAAAAVDVAFDYGFGSVINIPKGTRNTADGVVYWATDEDTAIEVGETSVTVGATCELPGAAYNGVESGAINSVVDLYNVGLTPDVRNITVTVGGNDRQSDDSYRQAITLATNQQTTAGTVGAYEYWVRQADPDIVDVFVWSPTDTNAVEYPDITKSPRYNAGVTTDAPGEVFVHALTTTGGADEEVKGKIEELIADVDSPHRTLTDLVHVCDVPEVSYSVEVVVYATAADKSVVEDTTAAAIADFITWQQSKLGRDIDPGKLEYLIRKYAEEEGATAQRVSVLKPQYTAIKQWAVAIADPTASVTILPIEDGEVAL